MQQIAPRRFAADEVMRWKSLSVAVGFGLFAASLIQAQSFTNSATLAASLEGTNLVISYSMANDQGWVTLFSADHLDGLATEAKPVDLARVPLSKQGQFRVPIQPLAPTKFYKLLVEQWPTRGKALVFTNGPVDFAAMRRAYGDITPDTPGIFREPGEVWLGHLGIYDANGVQIGSNGGYLDGRWGRAEIYSLDEINPADFSGLGPVPELNSPSNDFRVDFTGAADGNVRNAVLQSSEANFYYFIDDYRTRFLNDEFIDSLNMPAQQAQNLKHLQYRPDLQSDPAPTLSKPIFRTDELIGADSLVLGPVPNIYSSTARTRANISNFASLSPLSLSYDAQSMVGDYAGLAAFWTTGFNTLWPLNMNNWQANMIATLNDGISHWAAYRYSGNSELYSYFSYAGRTWLGTPCGGTNVACDKGQQLRNVMMVDEQNGTANGVFPFSVPSNIQRGQGPSGLDLSSLFIGALFYDIANEAGLGMYKADQLLWKTVSMITDPSNLTMRLFGQTIQLAARALWPLPGNPNLSIYENDIVDVLTSRGIPMNGVSDFRQLLPAAAAPSSKGFTFATSHPLSQPNVNSYGVTFSFNDGYTVSGNPPYVAYRLYKHSKMGPCDKIQITDGTFNQQTGAYNNDGSFSYDLTDRELGNLVILAPGGTIRWLSSRVRCPNEATGSYVEDVSPFGFITTEAVPNGFSFTASALSETATNKTYQLAIVDPSTNALGAATYAWTFTDYAGNANLASGSVVQYTALKDQPLTIGIARSRATQTDTLTLRERGNDLDRNEGNAFVRNLVQ